MKTRNNVQKAVTKTMAVIMSLVLLSITVNAQEFWKNILRNNSFSQIAYAMAEESTEATIYPTEAVVADYADMASLFVAEAEPSLPMESWMLDVNRFSATTSILTETESALELEDWMVNESFFSNTASLLTVDKDAALELEGWMTDEANFKTGTLKVENEVESKLEVKDWMTNSLAWKF